MANIKPVSPVKRKAGNPNWGKTWQAVPVTVIPSMFELAVAKMKLKPSEYEHSTALRKWVEKNHTKHYIPLDLLDLWGLSEIE